MYHSRNDSSEFQVKKVRIILCASAQGEKLLSTNIVDNNSNNKSIDIRTNGGFEGGGMVSGSEAGGLGKKSREGFFDSKNNLRRIVISRKKKRKKLSTTSSSTKKPMFASLFLIPPTSSSKESSPSSRGERTVGILAADEEDIPMNSNNATISHGLISVIGRRRSMEDAVTVVPSFVRVSNTTDPEVAESTSFDFFAVYDGHGGYAVANRCKDRLHHLVAEEITAEIERGGQELDWVRVMSSSFARMDEEVAVEATDEGAVKSAVGSTALVVVVGKEEVVVANAGDCRAVLGVSGGAALPLSRDHKPERPDEKERVEAAGGNVVNWDCSRVLGVLATSRSIGDHYLKPYVTAEPEVTVHKRSASDEFLIIASDGLWDVVPNEVACELVRKCFCGQVRRKVYEEFSGNCAAAVLAELALARGSRDNISVIVVELQRSSSSSTSTSSTPSP